MHCSSALFVYIIAPLGEVRVSGHCEWTLVCLGHYKNGARHGGR
jgi:hypothetical protein